MDPRAGLDAVEKKIFLTLPGLGLRIIDHPARSSRYTDCSKPVLKRIVLSLNFKENINIQTLKLKSTHVNFVAFFLFYVEYVGSRFGRYFGVHLPNYTASHTRNNYLIITQGPSEILLHNMANAIYSPFSSREITRSENVYFVGFEEVLTKVPSKNTVYWD
jgi:hypothetical protein